MGGSLDGRCIIVTGAGTGLGAAYAMASAAAGASVLVNDIDPVTSSGVAQQIRAAGGAAVGFAGDVADWDQAGEVVATCVREFGAVDGLVNNAGILGTLRKIFEEAPDARRILEVNVLGTMHLTAHVTKRMVESSTRGSIVNVTSGNQCGHKFVSTYGASKGAVASYTYAWARELKEHGIRVNAISPNAATNQLEQVIAQLGENPEKHHAVLPSLDDNASVVTYLLSDLSAGLTGQVLRVAHGTIAVMSHPLLVEPLVEVSQWTPEELASLVQAQLLDHLQPLGIATAQIRPTDVVF